MGYITKTVEREIEVEIDTSDVLEELTDDELREECLARGIEVGKGQAANARDLITELRRTFEAGDRQHFEVLLLRAEEAMGLPRDTIPKAKGDLFAG